MEDSEILRLLPDHGELHRALSVIEARAAACSRTQSSEETYWQIERMRFWRDVAARLASRLSGIPD